MPHDGDDAMSMMSGPMWMPSLPPTAERIFAFHLQPIPLLPVLALIGLLAYWLGVAVLARRGVHWGWWRAISWTVGILLIEEATATGIEGYGMALFSVHMAQHMALGMVAPILLVAGSPMTLALRALPVEGTGSSIRRALLAILANRVFHAICSIPFRWFFFLFGLYGIYFTSLFDKLMSNVWGHNLMLIHFVLSGILFFGPLVHADPWPTTKVPVYRLLEAFASSPFHAFFGITLMMMNQPVVQFYAHPPATWHIDVLSDQNLGGAIAWVSAELPTVMLMGLIVIQWVRSDQRAAKRSDRREARTGDAELVAYNAMLAELARADDEATAAEGGH